MCSLLCCDKTEKKKGYEIDVRQYLCVKKNNEKAMAFPSQKKKKEEEREKDYTNDDSYVAYVVCMYVCVCVLYETMIFVHILKCIPARYRHDEDAEDALALGRRRVHGRDETPAFICTCPPSPPFSSYLPFPSIKSNEL